MIVVVHPLPPHRQAKNKADFICILQVILMHKDDAWGRGGQEMRIYMRNFSKKSNRPSICFALQYVFYVLLLNPLSHHFLLFKETNVKACLRKIRKLSEWLCVSISQRRRVRV